MNLRLYSKPGCHLCEDLRALLADLQTELGFSLEETDITRDPELYERYRHEIPVLFRDGKEIARGRVSDRELMVLLRPKA